MDNQHRKIKGYRELSQEEIDLMKKAYPVNSIVNVKTGHLHSCSSVPVPDVGRDFLCPICRKGKLNMSQSHKDKMVEETLYLVPAVRFCSIKPNQSTTRT